MWADAPALQMPTPSTEAGASSLEPPALAVLLASLGPVLCLHRRDLLRLQHPDDWIALCAGPARALCELSTEGPREALRFFDRGGRPLLQVCMLSDSDFLGWEQALQAPGILRDPSPAPLCQLPWLASLRWKARLLQFERPRPRPGPRPSPKVSEAGRRLAADWCRRYGCALGEP